VQIGAVLTLSEREENENDFPGLSTSGQKRLHFLTCAPQLNVLGHDLRQRAIGKLRALGIEKPTVISVGPLSQSSRFPAGGGAAAWEAAIAQRLSNNVEVLFLLRDGVYTDLDLRELLQFHLERKAALTQVYAADGSVDVAVVNASALRASNPDSARYKEKLSALIPQHERFFHRGYVNRLRKPTDFARLVEDGLYGRCDLRPNGTEIASGVWFGEDAEVDPSCVIGTPSYVGAGTRIAACCAISRGSAIERACEVDSGTTIEHSWILPGTYVGLGLHVCRSIVGKKKMFHLDRNTQVTISDRRLIGATRSIPWFGGLSNRAPASTGPGH